MTHYHISSQGTTSPLDLLNRVRASVIRFVKERPRNKVQISLICEMMRLDPTTGDIASEELASFNPKQEPVFDSTDLETMYERMTTKVLESSASYLKNGSGWVLKKVIGLDITVSRLRPVRGSSHIPLPEKCLERTKALINMQNHDQQCFKWAVTRALNPVDKNPQRITKELRKQVRELNWEGIEFPTPCSEKVFKKFEKNNNVSLLVFGHEVDTKDELHIIPLYVPTKRYEKLVRLFFFQSDDGSNSHYCVIKDMSRLVARQVSKKEHKKYVCDYCLNYFGPAGLIR